MQASTMLELAMRDVDPHDLFRTDKISGWNKPVVISSIVSTCVRAEEATYIVRSYIYAVILYSYAVN